MRILIDVDFPAPFGPMKASRSPAATSKEMPRTASTVRRCARRPLVKVLVRPSTWMVMSHRGRTAPARRGGLRQAALMSDLATVAPAFVDMAHRIVWCTVATVDPSGRPRTRVLHPIWEHGPDGLTGWIATSPLSPKAKDLAAHPTVSLTYWAPNQDTCTADCDAEWTNDLESKRAGWDRFANAPAPVGYNPKIIPGWSAPEADAFGILRLTPRWLRVFPGTVLMTGQGQVLTWRA